LVATIQFKTYVHSQFIEIYITFLINTSNPLLNGLLGMFCRAKHSFVVSLWGKTRPEHWHFMPSYAVYIAMFLDEVINGKAPLYLWEK